MRVGLGREADGTVHLDVLRRILQRCIHGHQLGGNAVKLPSRALLGLHHRGEDHLAQRGFRPDGHVGTEMFDGLKGADGLTELLPVFRVFNGHVTGGLGNAHRIGGEEELRAGIDRLAFAFDPQRRPDAGQQRPLEPEHVVGA